MLYETELVYLKNAYQTELETEIIRIGQDETGSPLLYLDSTLFYPEGGGQPSDVGTISGPNGTAQVIHARYQQGVVAHRCEIDGSFNEGDAVICRIDWHERHHNMRAHTAGHVLHDALVQLPHPPDLFPLKGNHKNLYVDYTGSPLPGALAIELEQKCNQIIAADYETVIREVDLEELQRICDYIPANLPIGKPLRVVKIGPHSPMPCGGTHVQRTGEIGPMKILGISLKKGVNHIKYQLSDTAD